MGRASTPALRSFRQTRLEHTMNNQRNKPAPKRKVPAPAAVPVADDEQHDAQQQDGVSESADTTLVYEEPLDEDKSLDAESNVKSKSGKKVIVILEKANLETIKSKRGYALRCLALRGAPFSL